MENICRFIPYEPDGIALHTVNFVLETLHRDNHITQTNAVYKMYYVCRGNGLLHLRGTALPLTVGDVFFTFPSTPFAIEAAEHFEYMYISFLGTRANILMEQLAVNSRHCIFHDMTAAKEVWERGIRMSEHSLHMISESVLLYTFACISDTMLRLTTPAQKENGAAARIKKYIDERFTDSNFSLEAVSRTLAYNKKYISAVFKKDMGVSVNQYLNTVRIQQACAMIAQGFTCVNDISLQCGFSDPAYFSRVFRKQIGVAPGVYIKSMRSGDAHT